MEEVPSSVLLPLGQDRKKSTTYLCTTLSLRSWGFIPHNCTVDSFRISDKSGGGWGDRKNLFNFKEIDGS